MIELELFENFEETSVQIPYTEGQLISLFHEQGHVKRIEHNRKGVFIQGQLPGRLLARFTPFYRSEPEPDIETTLNEEET
jgi:GTP-binding protein HflX